MQQTIKRVESPATILVLAVGLSFLVWWLDPIRWEESIWIASKIFGGAISGMLLAWLSARLSIAKEVQQDTLYRSRTAIICVCVLAASLGG